MKQTLRILKKRYKEVHIKVHIEYTQVASEKLYFS